MESSVLGRGGERGRRNTKIDWVFWVKFTDGGSTEALSSMLH